MSNYRAADKKSQWIQDRFPGSVMDLSPSKMVVVLHTTEGSDWPDYGGGSVAPNYTGMPPLLDAKGKWRAHFPDERSARALQNDRGGVETNTLNAVQIELVGTCDPRNAKRWGNTSSTRLAGEHYVYWPEADARQLKWVARILADFHRRHGFILRAPVRFAPYPESYGSANGVRLSASNWLRTVGVVGHQHVPENDHGDPGNIDIEAILGYAKKMVA
jgi:hypothetical protein